MCDYALGIGDSQAIGAVVCRQLNLPLPALVTSSGIFGPATAPKGLRGAYCTGTESRLDDCPKLDRSNTNCGNQLVEVVCNATGELCPGVPSPRATAVWGSWDVQHSTDTCAKQVVVHFTWHNFAAQALAPPPPVSPS